ncbi:gastricsin-like, partial [Malurus melanocephalus]|uniref:gastricsin-like n=1 Tax=Malurus melanocephalus TaxID=175006 RepID=UPI002547FCD4
HARFNHRLSSTFLGIDESYTLSYGFGDVAVALGWDTVTLTIPGQFMAALLQALGAEESEYGFLVDCSSVPEMPTLSFAISGAWLALPPSIYILQNDGVCTVGVESTYVSSSSGQPLWILGNLFLRQYYSIFDMANNRVGLATAV